MFKFNNNNIFTGYLKQLLSSFNLPTYKVYTKENAIYRKKYGVEKNIIESVKLDEAITSDEQLRYISYIKDGAIQRFVNNSWEYVPEQSGDKIISHIKPYYYNAKILNHTKNLKIRNNIYDSYTHEYLGDYLRFIRDYTTLDLMPLYNCFSNRICDSLYIKCDQTVNNKKIKFIFTTKDTNYKIYMIPVKLFKEYTIAIDSSLPVEVCCGIYGKHQYTNGDKFSALYYSTYKKYSNCKFNKPLLYSDLLNINNFLTKTSLMNLAQNEDDLKLFIKVPITNESSITVLEGNYLNNTKELTTIDNTTITTYQNKYVFNFDNSILDKTTEAFTPITQLQLLQMNTGENYPFADRLVEYLVGQVITENDDIGDNIKRLQAVLKLKGKTYKDDGLWEPLYRPLIYTYMTNNKTAHFKINHDNLGYVDKDAEHYISAKKAVTLEAVTLENVDIYPDLYLGDK